MAKPAITVLLLMILFSGMPVQAQEASSSPDTPIAKPPVRFSISVMPVYVAEEKIGFGLCYEYFLGNDGKLSLSLPVFYSFPHIKDDRDFHHDENFRFTRPPEFKDLHYSKDEANGSIYFNPSLKVHPGKMNSKFRYAFGASIVLNAGSIIRQRKDYEIRPVWLGSSSPEPRVYERTLVSERIQTLRLFKMGAMFTNSIYYYTGKHLFAAAELGLGYGFISKLDGFNEPNDAIMQVAFKIGFAW